MKRRAIFSFLTLIVVVLLILSHDAHGAIAESNKLYGINFSPYVLPGEDPTQPCCRNITEKTLRTRISVVAPYTRWIRTFGSQFGLEKAGRIAHQLGLKIAMGAWLNADRQSNEKEINSLISRAQEGDVDMCVVGSEVLLRKDLTARELVGYVRRVRQAVPRHIPVTSADIFRVLMAHADVLGEYDVVLPNFYPFWEGIAIEDALPVLKTWHQKMQAVAGDKPVWVSETGWPSAGSPVGKAIPSPKNASLYFNSFVEWCRKTGVKSFYFEAFEEAWKSKFEGDRGASWGIFDAKFKLKEGMKKAFQEGSENNRQ